MKSKENHLLNAYVLLLKNLLAEILNFKFGKCPLSEGSEFEKFLSPNYSKFAAECD